MYMVNLSFEFGVYCLHQISKFASKTDDHVFMIIACDDHYFLFK